MEGFLVRPKKKSILNKAPIQLNDINHDMENIKVSNDKQKLDGDKDKPNFKKKYFLLSGNKLIQMTNDGDTMERGILNIKYARLKKTHLKDSSQKLWGFILMAKGITH
jgi:hypothetical protein